MTASAARRSMPAQVALGVLVGLVVSGALWAFFNSGRRGAVTCSRDGMGGPGTLSLWPPGTTCRGGEPVLTFIELNSGYVLLTLFAGIASLVLVLATGVYLRGRPN